MLGRLRASDGGRGKVRRGEVLDLPVLECWVDLNGRWGKHRAEKALCRLARRARTGSFCPRVFRGRNLQSSWDCPLLRRPP